MKHLLLVILFLSTASARAADEPSYQRHVSALFSRLGCNGGTCHGAVKGQNGFRLSLFGADPTGDAERMLREFGARRLNFTAPAASLLLKKATGQSEHGGGVRLQAGSAEYETIRRWIAAGAKVDAENRSQVRELRVSPDQRTAKPGDQYPLKVEAKFADGSTEDVTAYCSFESMDKAAAGVDANGRVTGRSPGDASIIVRYRAFPALARVVVPRPATAAFPDVKPNNFIDAHVLAKLKEMNLPPSAIADDAVFLRRVHLDVTGQLPAPAEVRSFLSDTSADKREKKIEELFKQPGHAALWTLKFCDLLKAADYGVYADALSLEADAPRFQAWIRARMEENTPYDVLVERILLATSKEGRTAEEYASEVAAMMEGYGPQQNDLALYKNRKTLDLYWQRRGADGLGGAMQVAHSFLGLRMECAQCHRHPHDVWRQEDLLDFANFFMRVRTVGFQGDNEKKFPDMAAIKKRFDDHAKQLEADIKKRKDTEGKKIDDEVKAAKTPEDKKAMAAKAEKFRQEMQTLDRKAKMLPEIGRRLLQAEIRVLPPGPAAKVTSPLGSKDSKTFRLLGESEAVAIEADRDPREAVMAWMRRPDNPYFARAIVNRVWAHYFGRGLVDPPDNLSAFNPASHPALLKELCDGFVRSKYDLRWLHRTILTSRTYQQATAATADAAIDRANYAAFPLRKLGAEVMLDALNFATGTTEKMDMKYYHWPDEMSTVEVPFAPKNAFVSFVLENYGRPKRNAAVQCDCERDGGASVFQVLALANHPRLWEKVRDPAGRVSKLVMREPDTAKSVDELFLATLSRLPAKEERDAAVKYVESADSPEKGLHGVLWSLLNTREFLLQH
ncbi:MAG: DUF1553 domain-containing protein [Gemmataceae bacterium]